MLSWKLTKMMGESGRVVGALPLVTDRRRRVCQEAELGGTAAAGTGFNAGLGPLTNVHIGMVGKLKCSNWYALQHVRSNWYALQHVAVS